MISELYQKAILSLAAEAAGAGRLETPDATVSLNNPLCGDHVTLDLTGRNGRITALAHELRACVICQASASILGKQAVGSDEAEIEALVAALEAMLKESGPAPAGKWREYQSLEAVVSHRNRHECVLLPVRAAAAALKEIAENE